MKRVYNDCKSWYHTTYGTPKSIYTTEGVYIYNSSCDSEKIIMMPSNRQSLEKEYKRCIAKKAFVQIPKEAHTDYIKEAYSDIASAEEDVEKSPKWAIVKAYQALFMMTNALSIKKLGFYSKDHGCILVALMNENVIPSEILSKISAILAQRKKTENFFDEVSNIRIARNKYLYLPETHRKLDVSVADVVDEIKEIIRILGDLE